MTRKVEYEISVEYALDYTQLTPKRRIALDAIAEEFGLDETEVMSSNLTVTLDEVGYKVWLHTMICIDPSFISAPHYWSRGDDFVSKVGDRYRVEVSVV